MQYFSATSTRVTCYACRLLDPGEGSFAEDALGNVLPCALTPSHDRQTEPPMQVQPSACQVRRGGCLDNGRVRLSIDEVPRHRPERCTKQARGGRPLLPGTLCIPTPYPRRKKREPTATARGHACVARNEAQRRRAYGYPLQPRGLRMRSCCRGRGFYLNPKAVGRSSSRR